jgi:hypothetical protein
MTGTQPPLERVRNAKCGVLPGSTRQAMFAAAIWMKRSSLTVGSRDNG